MPDLEHATVDEIINELAQRGFHGVIAITKLPSDDTTEDVRGVSVLGGCAPLAVGMADEALRRARADVDEDLA